MTEHEFLRERNEARAEIERLRVQRDAARNELGRTHGTCVEAQAEVERLREALQSIAGKPNPSGDYCQRVAKYALGQDLNAR